MSRCSEDSRSSRTQLCRNECEVDPFVKVAVRTPSAYVGTKRLEVRVEVGVRRLQPLGDAREREYLGD